MTNQCKKCKVWDLNIEKIKEEGLSPEEVCQKIEDFEKRMGMNIIDILSKEETFAKIGATKEDIIEWVERMKKEGISGEEFEESIIDMERQNITTETVKEDGINTITTLKKGVM